MAKRWTAAEDRALLMGLGAYGVNWFLPRTGRSYTYKGAKTTRSVQALYHRVRRLCGGGGLGRGAYSLREMVEKSGYSRPQILRAREALNQKWKRITPKGAYIVTEEQAEDVFEWLKHDYWCPRYKLYACRGCSTKKKPPRAHGLCCTCYFRHRRGKLTLKS